MKAKIHDIFIRHVYSYLDNRGIDPMVAVLPFMVIAYFSAYFTLKGLFWILTWGIA